MTNSDHYLLLIEITTPAKAGQQPPVPEIFGVIVSALRAAYVKYDESLPRINLRLWTVAELEHEIRMLP